MSDGVFFTTCGEDIPLDKTPECQRLVQIVRLVPKVPEKKTAFKPDLSNAFKAMSPVLGKIQEIPIKGVALDTSTLKPGDKEKKDKSGKKKKGQLLTSTAAPTRLIENPFPKTFSGFKNALDNLNFNVPNFPIPGLPPIGPITNWLKEVDIGLVVVHDQCWKSAGYARGALLNTFPLTPGEQVTIETFTWDRKKIEREHTAEDSAESERSGSLTGRVSDEVVLSSRFKLTAGAEAGVDGSVSLKDLEIPADVGANGSANVGSELETSTGRTSF